MTFYNSIPKYPRDILYGFSLVIHAIVPLVFWLFLRETVKDETNPTRILWNYFVHGSDFVIIFIHFLMFDNDFPIQSLYWNLIFVTVYVGWAWIGFFILGEFVYPFMDFNHPDAKYLYPGIYFLVIALTFVWYFIHKLKNKRKKHVEINV